MKKNIFRLFNLLGEWRRNYLMAASLLIVAIFVRNLEPKILQIAIDELVAYLEGTGTRQEKDVFTGMFYYFLPESGLSLILLMLGGMYLIVSLFRGGFMLTASALSASSTENSVKYLRDRLFSHIQALPLNFHNRLSTGELIQRSTGDVDTIRKFLLNQVMDVIRLSFLFIFSFIMIWVVDWQYALISIALVPFIALGGFIFFRKEGKVWEEHEKEADKLNDITKENLDGIRIVQSFAREEFEMEKFDRQNKRKRAMGLKHVDLHAIYWPLSDLFVLLQITISVLAGGYFSMIGQISLGELVSCYTYLIMVAWPLRQVGRVLSEMGMATVAIGRIYEILEAPEEQYEGATISERIKGAIQFDRISFSYSEEGKDILRDLSFSIQPGERVAIVGPTGSGKSTIVKLLLRFFEPDKGKILLDGFSTKDLSKHELRKKIGLVSQKPFLFSSSIRDNIKYANREASKDSLSNTVSIAQIEELEQILPEGYETVVGEKGVTLSGGQKQRVALARTILSDPDILILDDITSALDVETEQMIFEKLEILMKRKTTILISHRVASIKLADRILVVDNGVVTQEGTHESLKNEKGYYRSICELQLELGSQNGGGLT